MGRAVNLGGWTGSLLARIRGQSQPVRMLLGFALGGLAVAVAFFLMGAAGIDYRVCPVGPTSYLIRVVALWALAGAAVGLPVRLLSLDPVPFAGVWLLMALLWKYGPFLSSLVPH